MKKAQLKQLLKPIIRECIREAFLEQGMLSGIISEVVKGIQPLQASRSAGSKQKEAQVTAFKQQQLQAQRKQQEEERYQQLKEQKTKLLNATGFSSNIFEDVQPLNKGGNPDKSHQGAGGPLADMDPTDPGVDISGIMALGGQQWKKLV